jgi:hypothetical protein
MGAGDFEAGAGPAGEDPVVEQTPYQPIKPPAAIYLDLATRDSRLDSNGNWDAMDTTEQQVVISFAYFKGTVKSAPNVGNDFNQLPRNRGAALIPDALRIASEAFPFSDLIAKGYASLEGVIVQSPKWGEARIAVQWRNLRKDPNQVVTTGVSGT